MVDPRTLVPLDTDTIPSSARKTEHVVIAQEAVRRGGVARDIASIIQQQAFDHLDAAVEIVAGKETPIPFNHTLERTGVPGVDDIVRAGRKACYRDTEAAA